MASCVYTVWSVGFESSALTVVEECPEDAVIAYAEQDVDGLQNNDYTLKNGHPLTSAKDGALLVVQDENNELTYWNVGIVEFEPVFGAIQTEKP